MLSQMDSTLTTLSVILETLEQSASLAEKITQMEGFISTLFSCSTENIGQEMSVNSMWVDATQTLSAAIVHQKKDGTTRRKMVTLWEEDLSDRAEMEYLRLARSGLSLSWQEIETSFFEMCADLAPRALLCNFTSLRCYADWRFRADPAPYEHPVGVLLSTERYPQLDTWVQQNLGGPTHSGE